MGDSFDCEIFAKHLAGSLDERTRRHVASAASLALGHGGVSEVSRSFGLSRTVIHAGQKELAALAVSGAPAPLPSGRQRMPGGGAKRIADVHPELLASLDSLIQPYTRGDPESPLRWTSKSLRHLATELNSQGHRVSHTTVGKLLSGLGYTLQGNRKSIEGGLHPDRDAQFEHINDCTLAFQEEGMPVVSVDSKKKELVGNYKNAGREYSPEGSPEEVGVYDFPGEGGKATPYGVYDIAADEGFVNVGVSHDTASFAADSLRRWWETMGSQRYGEATAIYITADGGGSNGTRNKLWKFELQQIADDFDMDIYVSHFPPGTSKWNKIEHRLFSFISMNWRGKPLRTTEVIVSLIAGTKTSSGLTVKAELSKKAYETGVKVTDEEAAAINITTHQFHPEWNYVIRPKGRGQL